MAVAVEYPPLPLGNVPDEAKELMVQWIQHRIKVNGYYPSLWTEEHSMIATVFLSNPCTKSLFACIDSVSQRLIVCHSSPPNPSPGRKEVAFFVRMMGSVLTPQNISHGVQFGMLAMEQTPASVLHFMESIFYKRVFCLENWSQSSKKELMALYHRFTASLQESVNEEAGRTRFYIPFRRGDHRPDVCEAALDRDLVQQFESIVILWTRQIKAVLNNYHSSTDADIAEGPTDEIAWWNARAVDLSHIAEQLNNDEIIYVISVLKHSKSNYLTPLTVLSEKILEASKEAKSNLRFLAVLSEPCDMLGKAELKDMPKLLPRLLNCVRVIGTLSPHYNTTERVSDLLRMISTEIIRQCRQHISLDQVFIGDLSVSMESLQQSVQCGVEWKSVYRKTVASLRKHAEEKGGQDGDGLYVWDFPPELFAQLDAFVQRCRDLLEICDGRIQFTAELDSHEFGGTNGNEIKTALKAIGHDFKKEVKNIHQLRYDILDVKKSTWHDDFNSYKTAIKDLDLMWCNIITKAFEPIQQVEFAVNLLGTFSKLARRDMIHRCVGKKADDIRLLFAQKCNLIRQEFDDNRRSPPMRINEPQHAGAALWARSLTKTVQRLWSLIQNAACPIVHHGDNAEMIFKSLVSALDAFQGQRFKDWLDTLHSMDADDLKAKLEQVSS